MSKLPHTPTSIFSVMSQLAQKHNAVNLSQGFPNFPVNENLVGILEKLQKENIHQYTPMSGLPKLMEQIELLTFKSYGRKLDSTSELLISSGATQGIFTAITALISSKDEVIILDPSYDSYEPSVLVAGGTPVRVNLSDDFSPNFNRIEDAITSRTKLIIVNNPHNPTGRIWTESDFENLETILEKHPKILVLSDEVYEYISFSHAHISFNTRPKLAERTIVASSFGKSLHVTGWKVGYLIAPKSILDEIKKIHQFLVFSVNSTAQHAIAEYLNIIDFSAISKMYQQKRDLFQKELKESRFKLLPCQGTYFQVADYSAISTLNDVDFAKELTIKYGVAAIPISVFYKQKMNAKLLRFCFAKTDETITNATNKLRNI
jgi:methionine aminotransferase